MRHITCAQIEPWLEAYVDGELEPWMVAVVQAHIGECDKCMGSVKDLRAINRAVREWALSDLPATEGLATETTGLARLLGAEARLSGIRPARRSPLAVVSAGARRIGLDPRRASRAVLAGGAWGGRLLARGARVVAGTVIAAASSSWAGERRSEVVRPRPSWAVRAAAAAGRQVGRTALAGAKWVGREALALG